MVADGIQFVMSEAWAGIPASHQKFPPCPNTQLPAAQATIGLTTGAYALLNFTNGSPSLSFPFRIAIDLSRLPQGCTTECQISEQDRPFLLQMRVYFYDCLTIIYTSDVLRVLS